jgi:hypothetical protein
VRAERSSALLRSQCKSELKYSVPFYDDGLGYGQINSDSGLRDKRIALEVEFRRSGAKFVVSYLRTWEARQS